MASAETEGKRQEKEVLPPAGLAISSEAAKAEGEANTPGDDHKERTQNDDDEDLFKSPPREECPLCLITMPIRSDEITYKSCCGKIICNGCMWKHKQVLFQINLERTLEDPPKPPLERSCAFCRKSTPVNNSEMIEMFENRMALGDSEAFAIMGGLYEKGECGLARDVRRAFKFRHRAAELGSATGCFNLSVMYREGIVGADTCRDASNHEFYLKKAAKKGHIVARHSIGTVERNRGNCDVAVKHWMISAAAGHDGSTKNIGIAYRKKYATKDQYETAIRSCKDAKDEMPSEERDKAKAARAGC